MKTITKGFGNFPNPITKKVNPNSCDGKKIALGMFSDKIGNNMFSYGFLHENFEKPYTYSIWDNQHPIPNENFKSTLNIDADYLDKISKLTGKPLPNQKLASSNKKIKIPLFNTGWYYDKRGKFRTIAIPKHVNIGVANNGIGGVYEILRIVLDIVDKYKNKELINKIQTDWIKLVKATELLQQVFTKLPKVIQSRGKVLADICNCLCDNRFPPINSKLTNNPFSSNLYFTVIYQLSRAIFHSKSQFEYQDRIVIVEVPNNNIIKKRDKLGFDQYNTIDYTTNNSNNYHYEKSIIKATCPEVKATVEKWIDKYPSLTFKFQVKHDYFK